MGTQAAPYACTSTHSLHTLALLHQPLADCELPWADEGLDGTLLLPDGLACDCGTFAGPVSTAWLIRPVQAEPFCPAAAVGLDPSERLTAARSGKVGNSWMAALASGLSTLLTAELLPGLCNVTGASERNKALSNFCSALQGHMGTCIDSPSFMPLGLMTMTALTCRVVMSSVGSCHITCIQKFDVPKAS